MFVSTIFRGILYGSALMKVKVTLGFLKIFCNINYIGMFVVISICRVDVFISR